MAFFTEEKVPSPNDHLHVVQTAGTLVDASALNVTVRGAAPFRGDVLVKLASGAAGTAAFVTVIVVGAEVVFPPVVIAVSLTV